MLLENLYQTYKSFLRHFKKYPPRINGPIHRTRAVAKNFFLHIQSARIHKYSLNPLITLGLGLIAVFLLLILLLTGLMLMIYYIPSVERAYFSVKDIIFTVTGGLYLRNMHRWAAHGLVAVSILHMIRVFFMAAYHDERRINWLIGIGLLMAVLLSSFSGYLLPWDQLAFWAITIASNIASSANELTDLLGITSFLDIGSIVKSILLGGSEVTQATLTRFYMLHVVVLPITILVLCGLHFWKIRKASGLARPLNADKLVFKLERRISPDSVKTSAVSDLPHRPKNTILSWPTLIWAELATLMITFSAILLLALIFDAPLREMANPALPENPAKSPWYFLGLQELVSYNAFSGGVIIPLMVIFAMIFIPYLDREKKYNGIWFSGKKGWQLTWVTGLVSLFVLVVFVTLSVAWKWPQEMLRTINPALNMIINPGMLFIYCGLFWVWIQLKLTNSTRMAAVVLFTWIIAGYIVFTVIGIWFRGYNWEFVWF